MFCTAQKGGLLFGLLTAGEPSGCFTPQRSLSCDTHRDRKLGPMASPLPTAGLLLVCLLPTAWLHECWQGGRVTPEMLDCAATVPSASVGTLEVWTREVRVVAGWGE